MIVSAKIAVSAFAVTLGGFALLGEAGFDVTELKQAPYLLGVIVIVTLFLKHIKEKEKLDREERAASMKTMQEMGTACHSSQEKQAESTRVVLREVVKATDQNTAVSQALIDTVKRNN